MIDRNFLIRGFHYPPETYAGDKITHLLCDLTKSCNYRCLYCGNATHEDHGKNLTTNQRKKLIFDIKEFGLKTVLFAGEGEPMLDPDFKILIKHNYNLGLTTIVYSNLALANERMIEFLYNHDVSLVVKIDALDEEIYNRITGSKEFFLFKENLHSLISIYANQRKEKRIEVSTVLTEINKKEPQKIRQLCEANGWIYCCKTAGKKGNAGINWNELYPNGTKEIEKIAQTYTDKYQTTGNCIGNCVIAANGIAVLKSGECVLCPSLTEHIYANVKTDTIEEIVTTKRNIYNYANKPPCISKFVQNHGQPIEKIIKTAIPTKIKITYPLQLSS